MVYYGNVKHGNLAVDLIQTVILHISKPVHSVNLPGLALGVQYK